MLHYVHSSLIYNSQKLESLTSQVSGAFQGILETSYFLSLPISIISAGPQDFSLFPLSNTRSESIPHSTPFHFPSHVLLSLPTCGCFLLPPNQDRGFFIGYFSLLSSLSSVDCILCILYFLLFVWFGFVWFWVFG